MDNSCCWTYMEAEHSIVIFMIQQDQELVYDKCKNKLRLTIKKILELAFVENNFNSISIPAISSGVYRFPKDICAKIFNETIKEYFIYFKYKI